MPTLPNEVPPNVGASTRVISMRVIRAWAGAVAPRTSPATAIPDRASRRALPACVFIVLLLENKSSGLERSAAAGPAAQYADPRPGQ